MVKIHNTKDKILTLLISNKKEEFTIRAIAKKVDVDYKTVYLVVKDMIKDGIIKSKRAGQTILCSINKKKFNSDVFRVESLRRTSMLRDKDINVLYNRITDDIKEPFFTLLVFGSYASGKSRKGSDIDLMLITDDSTVKKKVDHIISLLPLRIHLVCFNSKEFVLMLKTTDFNVGREAFDNNVILFGIEDYYRLINYA